MFSVMYSVTNIGTSVYILLVLMEHTHRLDGAFVPVVLNSQIAVMELFYVYV
jgi:hypothetical protein